MKKLFLPVVMLLCGAQLFGAAGPRSEDEVSPSEAKVFARLQHIKTELPKVLSAWNATMRTEYKDFKDAFDKTKLFYYLYLNTALNNTKDDGRPADKRLEAATRALNTASLQAYTGPYGKFTFHVTRPDGSRAEATFHGMIYNILSGQNAF